jgi:hypothetical protein
MKKILFFGMLTIGLLFQKCLSAQQTFEKYYNSLCGMQDAVGYSVIQTQNGESVVLAMLFNDAGGDASLFMRLNASGDTLKTSRFDGSAGSFIQDISGDFVVAGGKDGKVLMMKADEDFNPLWANLSSEYYSTGRSVCELSDHGYCFAGVITRYWMPLKIIYVLKTNPQGEIIWERSFGDDTDDLDVHSIVEAPDGGILICGDFRLKNTNTISMGVMKISASGDSLWMKSYRRSDQSRGYQILPAHPGGYLLAGTDQPDNGPIELYLVRIDENGDTLWTRRYEGIMDVFALGATVTSDHGYAVAATRTSDTLNGPDLYLMRFNGQGDTVWTRSIGGAGTQSGRSIQQTADGGFVMTGYGQRPDMPESIYLVRTDSLGHFTPNSVENSNDAISDIRIFPNPSNGFFQVSAAGDIDKIEISDLRGNLFKEIEGEPELDHVCLPGADPLPPGIYLLKVFSGERMTIKKLIII